MPPSRTLHFPVITAFRIDRYALYPGRPVGSGLSFEMQPGVSVIAGINGLGKTTLLNALFRALTGPVEWRKRKPGDFARSTGIELGPWREASYFKDRVPDAAVNATVQVVAEFGDQRVTVTRSLETLEVLQLAVDDEELAADQGTYQETVCRLSGIERFTDFFVLLRYLVFVFEERQPLIWDPAAQADVLRVLFFDPDEAGRTRALFDDVQRRDSEFRNTRYQYNKLRARLDASRADDEGEAATLSQVKSLSTQLLAHDDALEALGERLEATDEARRNERLRYEKAKNAVVRAQDAYADAERHHFATAYPDAGEVAQSVLVSAATGGGCLVCGSRRSDVVARVRRCLDNGTCPVCDTRREEQEGVVGAHRVSKRRLAQLDKAVTDATAAAAKYRSDLDAATTEYDDLCASAARVEEQRADVDAQLRALQARLPLASGEAAKLAQTFTTLENVVKRLRAQLRGDEDAYARLLANGEQRVRAVAEAVTVRFAEYAAHFVAEDCDLVYEVDPRKVGEDTRAFDFPRFVVRMTSAGAPGDVQPRREIFAVSESQREFLDLAFRMALIAVASNGSHAMLVLETPEASLDSVFAVRAGGLLGEFAATGGNRLLATSNLTRGDMISALFGAISLRGGASKAAPAHFVPVAARRARVVDLLKSAAPNAALRKYAAEYTAALEAALDPPNRPAVPSRGRGSDPRTPAKVARPAGARKRA